MEYKGGEVPASSLKRVHVSHCDTPFTGGASQKQLKDYFKCRKVMGNVEKEDSPKNDHLYRTPKWNMLPCSINPTNDVTSLTHAGVQNQSNPSSIIPPFKDRDHDEVNKAMLPHLPQAGEETCNDVSDTCLNIKRENSQRGIYMFVPKSPTPSMAERYISIEKTQCEELREITLPSKVAFVYNPLEYAFEPHYNFVEKFCNSKKKILFLGMNPGPWGMSQNGVPFGEGSMVRDWLKISGAVLKPCPEHPKRLVTGLNCTRSEVSGRRFWGFFRDLCGSPETFFTNCFVYNMCPFAFMSETGKNITPPQIEAKTLQRINTACDKALLEVLNLLDITTIVGVGKFAYKRARTVLGVNRIDGIRIECIMHPSPINPAANKGWSDIVSKQLQELDLMDTIVN